ncbi:unnamed protein product [Urochloa decumbens]|uniref:Uncharacterized protein n=1 Tax=Urochloa decumbens TaxID=240449 RepID=A0ABC8XZZ1_9POAL
MAGYGTFLLRAGDLSAAIDGAISFVAAAEDPVDELARRRRCAAANGDRDDDVACGWSSAVVERGLALRRRGGSACSRRRDGLIRAAGEERGCRSEEAAAAPGALGIGAEQAAVAKAPVVDMVSFFCLAVL